MGATSECPLTHHYEEINGLNYHFVTGGTGPAIAFLHGFPDLWIGWKALMLDFIEAGFRVVAPDWRGFGETERPSGSERATALDFVGDLAGILDKLEIEHAGIVAHDLGSEVGWTAAKLRPDRFVAIASLSVPYMPRGDASLPEALAQYAPATFYFRHFLQDGVAERELDADPRKFLRRIFYTNSGFNPTGDAPAVYVGPTGLIDAMDDPGERPTIPTRELLDSYVEAFERTGFAGALDTYRSLHRGWELMAAWRDRTVEVPALYIGGEWDLILNLPGMRELVGQMKQLVPRAEEPIIFPRVGHFIHWERPTEVSAVLLDFFERHRGRC